MAKRRLPWILLTVSVLINVAFVVLRFVDQQNAPEDRLGILTRDVEVGSFSGTDALFRLPKGLTVRDASPRFIASIDQFEPHRFSIVFTTEDESAVSYQVPAGSLHSHEEYYSLDLAERRDDPPASTRP